MNPFISWPGAKYRQLPSLLPYIPKHLPAFCEPFLGSGAVTTAVVGRLDGPLFISEKVEPLIMWWVNLMAHPATMIRLMADVREEYKLAGEDRGVFNKLRDTWNRLAVDTPREQRDYHLIGAMLWVLIYQSTNNLARFNKKKGKYNQTWGKGRVTPDPFERFTSEELGALEQMLTAILDRGGGVYQDFRVCVDKFITKGCGFAYLDPPYIVRTETYNVGGWSNTDVRDLLDRCHAMDSAGIGWVMTEYLQKDDVVHPFLNEIVDNWKVVPLARKMDARPGGKDTGASEVIIIGKEVESVVPDF